MMKLIVDFVDVVDVVVGAAVNSALILFRYVRSGDISTINGRKMMKQRG